MLHQVSRRLVNNFGIIAIEALAVRNLIRRPRPKLDDATGAFLSNGAAAKAGMNTSISDAAWSQFFAALVDKAEEAERRVVKVPLPTPHRPVLTVGSDKPCHWRSDGTRASNAVW